MFQSPVDIALVAGVVLLLFGPKKVPEMGKALGLGIGNFKKALYEAQEDVKSAINTDPSQKLQTKTADATTTGTETKPETKSEVSSEHKPAVDETPRPIT